MKFQKPFLKWVGGKTQIIEKIMRRYPNLKDPRLTIQDIIIKVLIYLNIYNMI